VKEYDAVQRSAMGVLGGKHQALPKELVESFGHDPAAVTSVTRRLKGWRAVEDIHHRLVKQREIFSAFITLESHRNSDHESILDDKVSSLIRALSVLEERKAELAERSKDVERVLESVQDAYKDVKADYDKTVPLTSTLYPEVIYFITTS
jgi:DNA-binding transcriptional regulator GbsR (MarR family)